MHFIVYASTLCRYLNLYKTAGFLPVFFLPIQASDNVLHVGENDTCLKISLSPGRQWGMILRPKRLHWCWIILFAQSFNHYYLVFKHWRIYLSTLHGLQDFLDTGWWRQELWCRAISCLTQQSETYLENRPIYFAGCTWKNWLRQCV